MLCERCKKNEATFHKAIYINGKGYETNLCSECAGAVDFDDDFEFGFDDFEREFDRFTSDMFGSFHDLYFSPTMLMEKSDKQCPECHSTFSDFLRRGRLGCNKCYETFQAEIRDMLENMDNPTDLNLDLVEDNKEKSELDKLQDDFNKAIAEERYEDAGELKKKINDLRSKEDK